jgi:hypothetical protein
MTTGDVAQLFEFLSEEERLSYEPDDMLPFLVKQCQYMNLLSRDISTNYVELRKALTARYDLRPSTATTMKKTTKKDKEKKQVEGDIPSTSHAPDSPPLRKRKPTGDISSSEILECLQAIDLKLETINMLLGQLINNFQSWRQLDLPRGPTAVSMAPPAPPSVQTSATSGGQESVTLLTPMVLHKSCHVEVVYVLWLIV